LSYEQTKWFIYYATEQVENPNRECLMQMLLNVCNTYEQANKLHIDQSAIKPIDPPAIKTINPPVIDPLIKEPIDPPIKEPIDPPDQENMIFLSKKTSKRLFPELDNFDIKSIYESCNDINKAKERYRNIKGLDNCVRNLEEIVTKSSKHCLKVVDINVQYKDKCSREDAFIHFIQYLRAKRWDPIKHCIVVDNNCVQVEREGLYKLYSEWCTNKCVKYSDEDFIKGVPSEWSPGSYKYSFQPMMGYQIIEAF
jgi:hypothetical protein